MNVSADNIKPSSAGLGRALRLSIRMLWDRLGLMIAISMTAVAVLLVPPALLGLLPGWTPALVRVSLSFVIDVPILVTLASSVCRMIHLIEAREEVTYLDLWRYAVAMRGTALRLGLIDLLILSVLGVSLWFYLRLGHVVGIALALLCSYALLFFGTMVIYHAPVLAAQEMGLFDEPQKRAKRGAVAALRRAFFLALGSPLYSVGLLLLTVGLTTLSALLAVLLPLFWLGTLSLLTTQATRLLMIQYQALPSPPPDEAPVPDEKFRIR